MAIGNGGLVLEPTETDGAGFKLDGGIYQAACDTWPDGTKVVLQVRADSAAEWRAAGDVFDGDDELAWNWCTSPYFHYRFVSEPAGSRVYVRPTKFGQKWPEQVA